MTPRRSDWRRVDAVRRWLGLLAAVCVVLFSVPVGCAQATRDRLMQWFFEIPADSKETPRPSPGQVAEVEAPAPHAESALAPRFASVHPPFVQRRCDECHNAGERMQVREDALDSCRKCHEKYFSGQVGHVPVAQGQCVECHEMHRSREEALLRKPVFETCVECHEEPASLSPHAHGDADVRRCTKCHDAHFGVEKLLKAGVSAAAIK